MRAFRQADKDAGGALADVFYRELRDRAAAKMKGERSAHSWQTTDGLEGFLIGKSWGVRAEGIYFLANPDDRRDTVRFLSFATHRVVDVVTLDKEPNANFLSLAMSADGRYLLNGQVDLETNNLMRIENFR